MCKLDVRHSLDTSLRCSARARWTAAVSRRRCTCSARPRSSSVRAATIVDSLTDLTGTGPHGAGMTNILFAPRGASVVELYMDPNCNRVYGFMSMVLGLDYWVLPQVSTHFFGDYMMDKTNVGAAVRFATIVAQTYVCSSEISSFQTRYTLDTSERT